MDGLKNVWTGGFNPWMDRLTDGLIDGFTDRSNGWTVG